MAGYSQALTSLFDYAKSFENKSGIPLTAERFLIAIIDAASGKIEVDRDVIARLTSRLDRLGVLMEPWESLIKYIDDNRALQFLDAALLRRFYRRIYIDLPKRDDRIKYMKLRAEKNPAFELSEAKITNIAIRSTGMSLAELESVFEYFPQEE